MLRWLIIFFLLKKKERSIFLSNLFNPYYGLENYTECIGESIEEYQQELKQIKNKIIWKKN